MNNYQLVQQKEANGFKENSNYFKEIIRNITVEPIVVIYYIAQEIMWMGNENLNLEKSCSVHKKFNESICRGLILRDKSQYTEDEEIDVQKVVTNWLFYRSILDGLLPFFILLLMGSWSDRSNRRKPIILVALFGYLLSSIGGLISTHYFQEINLPFTMALQSIPLGLTGGFPSFLMGIFTYISSISSLSDRTVRVGFVAMTISVSIGIGRGLSGVLYRMSGFYGLYSFVLCIISLIILYTWFVLKEVPRSGLEKKEGCVNFFNFKHVVNTWSVCFKKGRNNRRVRFFGVIALGMICVGVIRGEITVLYLFARKQFGWHEMDFGIFGMYMTAVTFIGSLSGVLVLAKYLRLSDGILGVISITGRIVSSVINVSAKSSTTFYVGATADFLENIAYSCTKSLLSKIFQKSDLGKAMSIVGVAESISPFIFSTLYTKIYQNTVSHVPGAFFVFSVTLWCPALAIYYWFHREIAKGNLDTEDLDESHI